MSFLKPVEMTKVGVVGLKGDQEPILSALHDLGVVQVEPVGKEALRYVEPERASETQRLVGEELVRFRGLKSALPAVPVGAPRQFGSLAEVLAAAQQVTIDDTVGKLKRAEDAALTRRKSLTDTVGVLERFSFYTGRYEYLSGARLLSLFGETKPPVFERLRAEWGGLEDAQLYVHRDGKLVGSSSWPGWSRPMPSAGSPSRRGSCCPRCPAGSPVRRPRSSRG